MTVAVWWHDLGCNYEHKYNPNSPYDSLIPGGYCDPTKVTCDDLSSWDTIHVAASSYHPGGVNVGLADGSGRFVSETINTAVWQASGASTGLARPPRKQTRLSDRVYALSERTSPCGLVGG